MTLARAAQVPSLPYAALTLTMTHNEDDVHDRVGTWGPYRIALGRCSFGFCNGFENFEVSRHWNSSNVLSRAQRDEATVTVFVQIYGNKVRDSSYKVSTYCTGSRRCSILGRIIRVRRILRPQRSHQLRILILSIDEPQELGVDIVGVKSHFVFSSVSRRSVNGPSALK